MSSDLFELKFDSKYSSLVMEDAVVMPLSATPP